MQTEGTAGKASFLPIILSILVFSACQMFALLCFIRNIITVFFSLVSGFVNQTFSFIFWKSVKKKLIGTTFAISLYPSTFL